MSFNFPSNPTDGQKYTPGNGPTYVWRAPNWLIFSDPVAPTDSPIFTGDARAQTPVPGDADSSIATTKFVMDAIAADITPWSEITGQPATFPPTVPVDWTNIGNKPATFPPTLPIATTGVTGLDAAQTAQDNAIATKLNADVYTADDVFTKVTMQDGVDSGLDADLLDGQHGAYYSSYANLTGKPATFPPTLPIDWSNVSNKPVTFPPTLPIAESDVTNLTGHLAAKEPVIVGGTSQQYWRGDKTWQALPPP